MIDFPKGAHRSCAPLLIVCVSVYRQLWQLFESVRQHFAPASPGNQDASRGAEALDAATQKAVVDSVRAALKDTNDAAQQQQKQQPQQKEDETALGRPAPQQTQCSTDNRHRRKSIGQTVLQADNRDAGREHACQPSVCQAATGIPVQGDPDTVHMSHQSSVDSCAAKLRPDALEHRTCPAFGHPAVPELSLCHVLDAHGDHSCRTRADCGVDSVTCRARECSVHAFCQEGAR